VRQEDREAALADYRRETNAVVIPAATRLRELDAQIKESRTRSNAGLVEESKRFEIAERSLQEQLARERQAGGSEPDLDPYLTLIEQKNAATEHERNVLRQDYQAQRDDLQRRKQSALSKATGRRTLLIFGRETTGAQAAIERKYEAELNEVTKTYEIRDAVLLANIETKPSVQPSSHRAMMKDLEGQLESLRKDHAARRADIEGHADAARRLIEEERQTISGRIEQGLRAAQETCRANILSIDARDYSRDLRTQNALVVDTLWLAHELGATWVTLPRFAAGFAMVMTCGLEALAAYLAFTVGIALSRLLGHVGFESPVAKELVGKAGLFDRLDSVTRRFEAETSAILQRLFSVTKTSTTK
jgi:hypothetical protein